MIKTGIYQHYKGPLYEVLGCCYHSEHLEKMVVYRALYDSSEFGDKAWWVRPLEEFTSTVQHKEQSIPRFQWLREAE